MTGVTLETLRAASDHFGSVLAQVDPPRYGGPTPCAEWSVGQLVDHVVGGARWAALLLQGADGRAARAEVAAGPSSADRRDDWPAAAAAQLAAFAEPGALGRVVAHPIGPVPGAVFLTMRAGDLVVHSWDLARAVGAPERLPDDLVAAVLPGFETRAEGLPATGVFAAGPPRESWSADPQERLLQICGRVI